MCDVSGRLPVGVEPGDYGDLREEFSWAQFFCDCVLSYLL